MREAALGQPQVRVHVATAARRGGSRVGGENSVHSTLSGNKFRITFNAILAKTKKYTNV